MAHSFLVIWGAFSKLPFALDSSLNLNRVLLDILKKIPEIS